MANLAAPLDIEESNGSYHDYLMTGGVKVYAGSFAIIDANGYATKIAGGTAGQKFIGTVLETSDNTAGASGTRRLKVRRLRGHIRKVLGTGFTQALVGTAAYAADDNNVTGTAGTNTQVGWFVEIVSATEARISVHPTA